MLSNRYSCQNIIKREFRRQMFEKSSNIKFNKNPSSGSRVVPRGRTEKHTDITRLSDAFCNLQTCQKKSLKHFSNFGIQTTLQLKDIISEVSPIPKNQQMNVFNLYNKTKKQQYCVKMWVLEDKYDYKQRKNIAHINPSG